MKVLSKEKIKVLAETHGWSLAHAEGYVEGETFRRCGKTPSTYAQIGIDEYCLGFRAGYYERQHHERADFALKTNSPVASFLRVPMQRPKDSGEFMDATTGAAQSG